MINDAHVFIAGYVATEPTFKKVAGDVSFVRLRVAYTARRLNRDTGEWADGPTSFVSVQCWRGLADNVAMCLRKGEPVLVRGRLQVRRYENSEGAPRIAVEVDASAVGHDLTRGVAHFSRTRRSAGETAVEYAGSQSTAQAAGQASGRQEANVPGSGGSEGSKVLAGSEALAGACAQQRPQDEAAEDGLSPAELLEPRSPGAAAGDPESAAGDPGSAAGDPESTAGDPGSAVRAPGSEDRELGLSVQVASSPESGPDTGPAEGHDGDGVLDEGSADELAREIAESLGADDRAKVSF